MDTTKKETNEQHRYDDIIHLPHHVSPTRPHMSMIDRAAQFSPFAALSGYDDAVKETARLTDNLVELSDDSRAVLDMKQQILVDAIADHPEISVTYFVQDKKKAGGAYVTTTGKVKRIDEYERVLILMDGTRVPLNDILELVSELFQSII